MSKVKRMKRKRAAQKKANIRQMSVKKEMGPAKLSKRMARDHLDVLQNIEFTLVSAHRVSDDVWRDGLRTVLQSVHRHSDLRPGSRAYLDFVSDFTP